jgi:hypothetical protein
VYLAGAVPKQVDTHDETMDPNGMILVSFAKIDTKTGANKRTELISNS